MKQKIIILIAILLLIIGAIFIWYFDIFNDPVETLNKLIGKSYEYAHTEYFKSEPDNHYTLNINNDLYEFDYGILNSKDILVDSIIHVYTWDYINHKKTIWVGQTNEMKEQVIDAIRYRNNVQF